MPANRTNLDRVSAMLVEGRLYVIVVLFLSLLIASPFAAKIQFDFSPEALVHSDLTKQDSNELFGDEDRYIVIALEAIGDEDIFSHDALNWQYNIALALNTHAQIHKVSSLATIRLPNRHPLLQRKKYNWLFGTGTHTQESANFVRERVTEIQNHLTSVVSADLTCTAILAHLCDDDRKIHEIAEVVNVVEGILSDYPCPDGFKVHLSGLPAIRVEIINQLITDQQTLLPIAATLFALILIALFRRAGAVVLPTIALGAGLLWTIALLALFDEPFNVITNVLPIILLVIGISNCVHILSRYAEEFAETSDSSLAISRSMSHMIPACLLTTLTTAIGFLSLLFTNSELLFGFGWQAAMGLGFVYVALIAVFGSMGSYFRAPAMLKENETHNSSRVAEFSCAASRRRPVLVIAFAFCVAAFSLAAAFGWHHFKGVRVNSFLVETMEDDQPEIQSLYLIEEKLGGFVQVEVILQTEVDGLLTSPKVVDTLRRLTEQFESYKDISHLHSYVTIFKFLDAYMVGKPAFVAGQPISGDATATKRHEKIADGLRKKRKTSGLSQFLTKDERAGRIKLSLVDVGTLRGREIVMDLEAALAKEFPQESEIQTRLAGDFYAAIYSLDSFVVELFTSLVIASATIFFVLAIFFRSIRMGLISIFPNATPLLVTLGYMGCRGYDLNAANVMVFAIGLGIAVDDTIHFLARFRDEYLVDHDVESAIERTARGSGRAIVLTTILIVCGMVILLNSSFIPTQRFAELTIVTMISALLGDLLLLPAIIELVFRDEAGTSRSRKEAHNNLNF